MYRATTLAALQSGMDINDDGAVSALAEKIRIEVLPPTKFDGRQYTVLLDEDDVTWQIRQPDVDANVSTISAYPRVRAAMVSEQRRVAHRGRVVMVGRDIGTVVMPDADLKIYLDASVEERARRRYASCDSMAQVRPTRACCTACANAIESTARGLRHHFVPPKMPSSWTAPAWTHKTRLTI